MNPAALDAGAAATLVAFGLTPRARPANDTTYLDLLSRYRTDRDFGAVVDSVVEGLGLVVLDSSELGLVLAPTAGSVFAQRLADYRSSLSVQDRLLHGLIHVGIAAYCYPTAAALLDEDVRVASVSAVERFLRDAAQRLHARHGDADPDPDQPELEQAWRLYLRRQPIRETSDGRAGVSTTGGMIKHAMERLTDQGLLQRISDAEGGTYRALHRYRVGVRELAATEAYRTLAGAAGDDVPAEAGAAAAGGAAGEGEG
ncbi:MAG: hypothetical protein GEU81_06825 [Nitriliruptorales bacterium]|nr:hypothetical protein [Nitriliruptorales bacterium]